MVEAFAHLNLGFGCTSGWTPALRTTVCHFVLLPRALGEDLESLKAASFHPIILRTELSGLNTVLHPLITWKMLSDLCEPQFTSL